MHSDRSLQKVQGHRVSEPGSDMKLTPPIGCFGWCQLVFHDYFTAMAHNVH